MSRNAAARTKPKPSYPQSVGAWTVLDPDSAPEPLLGATFYARHNEGPYEIVNTLAKEWLIYENGDYSYPVARRLESEKEKPSLWGEAIVRGFLEPERDVTFIPALSWSEPFTVRSTDTVQVSVGVHQSVPVMALYLRRISEWFYLIHPQHGLTKIVAVRTPGGSHV